MICGGVLLKQCMIPKTSSLLTSALRRRLTVEWIASYVAIVRLRSASLNAPKRLKSTA